MFNIDKTTYTIEQLTLLLGDYVGHGFLNDHNIGASYNNNYWFSDYYSAKEYFDSIHDKNKADKLLTRIFS